MFKAKLKFTKFLFSTFLLDQESNKEIKAKQCYPTHLELNKRIVRRPWPKTNSNTFAFS